MPPNVKRYLTPDYRESIARTFAKATFAVIASEGKLDILGWIKMPGNGANDNPEHSNQSLSRTPGLPSWSVDFGDIEYSLFDTPVRLVLQNIWSDAPNVSKDPKYLDRKLL